MPASCGGVAFVGTWAVWAAACLVLFAPCVARSLHAVPEVLRQRLSARFGVADVQSVSHKIWTNYQSMHRRGYDTVRYMVPYDIDVSHCLRVVRLFFDVSALGSRPVVLSLQLRVPSVFAQSPRFSLRPFLFQRRTRLLKLARSVLTPTLDDQRFWIFNLSLQLNSFRGYFPGDLRLLRLDLKVKRSQHLQYRDALHCAQEWPFERQAVMLTAYCREGNSFSVAQLKEGSVTKQRRQSGVEEGSVVDAVRSVQNATSSVRGEDGEGVGRQLRSGKWAAEETGGCRVRDLTIDFRELGWGEWIVFPERYNAKVCIGQCGAPIAEGLMPTNHALLHSLTRLKRAGQVPSNVCAPRRLTALTLIYWERHQVVLRTYDNMVIAECGCF